MEKHIRYYLKYIAYLRNSGPRPTIKDFDVDWEPIGPLVRHEMMDKGLTLQDRGFIIPTTEAYDMLHEHEGSTKFQG